MRRVWSSLAWLALVYLIATGVFLTWTGSVEKETVLLWIGITYLPLIATAVLVAWFAVYRLPPDRSQR